MNVLTSDDLEVGICTVWNVGNRLRVAHADPIVYISDELWRCWLASDEHPDVWVDGNILTIDADNRRVVYRVDLQPMPDVHDRLWYRAEWPD